MITFLKNVFYFVWGRDTPKVTPFHILHPPKRQIPVLDERGIGFDRNGWG